MVRFVGKNKETYRIKNKPISEGFKLFVLADASSGYVLNFSPDGRMASLDNGKSTSGRNEYSLSPEESSKISTMISFLVSLLLPLGGGDVSVQFVVNMDYYFTIKCVMSNLRQAGIGALVTARARRRWPPLCLKVAQSALFSTFSFNIDRSGILIAR